MSVSIYMVAPWYRPKEVGGGWARSSSASIIEAAGTSLLSCFAVQIFIQSIIFQYIRGFLVGAFCHWHFGILERTTPAALLERDLTGTAMRMRSNKTVKLYSDKELSALLKDVDG